MFFHKLKNNTASKFFLLVGMSSIITYIAASQSVDAFKYASVFFQCILLVSVLKLLIIVRKRIDWKKATLFLLILCIYPTFHIFFTSVLSFETKKITDGLFLIAPYYQLPLVALAIAAYLDQTSHNLQEVIKQYLALIIPFVVLLGFFGFFSFSAARVGSIYNIFNNVFIPAIFLLFFHSKVSYKLFGLIMLITMLYFITAIGSRSYLLLCFYLIFLSILKVFVTRKKGEASMFFITTSLCFFPLFLAGTNIGINAENSTLLQKIQFDNLLETVGFSISKGDLLQLYYWEGNSRAQILLDAFSNFDIWNMMFGKTVFGLYQSFVMRNTIEVGWAQEAFWLGVVYVITLFFLIFLSLRHHLIELLKSPNDKTFILVSILLIRFLDGWIFGMPTNDIYNLVFFISLMTYCLNKSQHKSNRTNCSFYCKSPKYSANCARKL